jgi:hypothetical protein
MFGSLSPGKSVEPTAGLEFHDLAFTAGDEGFDAVPGVSIHCERVVGAVACAVDGLPVAA